jgi:hypothetical protein
MLVALLVGWAPAFVAWCLLTAWAVRRAVRKSDAAAD